ncbi:hypothetical protein C8R43DRAFT_1121881 [Mycena crocata]|nr:hypothetical protein C8R43DRAFT_1121881 [Mycena crocata]
MSSLHSSVSRSNSSSSVHSIANTVTSTTALTAAYRPPQKDYAAAFASLQSQYGTSGDFPGRVVSAGPPKKKQKTPASSAGLRSVPSSSTRGQPISPIALPSGTARSPLSQPALVSPPDQTSKAMESRLLASGQGMGEPGVDKRKSSSVSKLKKIFGVRPKGACIPCILRLRANMSCFYRKQRQVTLYSVIVPRPLGRATPRLYHHSLRPPPTHDLLEAYITTILHA